MSKEHLRDCPWTETDERGNKIPMRDATLIDGDQTYQIGPKRGKKFKGRLDWRVANRKLRRGAKLVLDVPGVGSVELGSSAGGGPRQLAKDRKVTDYMWGCPDGTRVRRYTAEGEPYWDEPTAAEKDAVADTLLLSTLARVRSDATQNRDHAQAVAAAAAARAAEGAPLLGAPGAPGAPKDNLVVRGLIASALMASPSGLPLLKGAGNDENTLASLLDVSSRLSLDEEAARLVLEHYPNASVVEAEMLARGLIGHEQASQQGRRANVFAVAGQLRDEHQRWAERVGPVSSDPDDRLRFRDEFLAPDSQYEQMPGLGELVHAAATGNSVRAAVLLHRAEASYPGAILWAALRSGNPDLAREAVRSLPAEADLEYVKDRAAADSCVQEPLLEEMAARRREAELRRQDASHYAVQYAVQYAAQYADSDSDSGSDSGTGAESLRYREQVCMAAVQDVLTAEVRLYRLRGRYPGLAQNPLFLRATLDELQDRQAVARQLLDSFPQEGHGLAHGTDQAREALERIAKREAQVADTLRRGSSVPEWLRSPEALRTAQDLVANVAPEGLSIWGPDGRQDIGSPAATLPHKSARIAEVATGVVGVVAELSKLESEPERTLAAMLPGQTGTWSDALPISTRTAAQDLLAQYADKYFEYIRHIEEHYQDVADIGGKVSAEVAEILDPEERLAEYLVRQERASGGRAVGRAVISDPALRTVVLGGHSLPEVPETGSPQEYREAAGELAQLRGRIRSEDASYALEAMGRESFDYERAIADATRVGRLASIRRDPEDLTYVAEGDGYIGGFLPVFRQVLLRTATATMADELDGRAKSYAAKADALEAQALAEKAASERAAARERAGLTG
jgi:hypothetical protein